MRPAPQYAERDVEPRALTRKTDDSRSVTMTTPERIILLAQLFSTFYMVGVIWFVQIVHYPLLSAVGAEQFTDYERRHCNLTSWVVAPGMLVELTSAVALMMVPASGVRPGLAWSGLLLVVLIWISTAVLQMPLHRKLTQQYSASLIDRLVATNWMRTIAWTVRGFLVVLMVWQSA